jgi:hypothetical protein
MKNGIRKEIKPGKGRGGPLFDHAISISMHSDAAKVRGRNHAPVADFLVQP